MCAVSLVFYITLQKNLILTNFSQCDRKYSCACQHRCSDRMLFASQHRCSDRMLCACQHRCGDWMLCACQHIFSDRMLCFLASVSVSLRDLGTSTKDHKIYWFGCSATENSNIKFTYRHWNCYGLILLLSTGKWGFSVAWAFHRAHLRIICRW